MQAIHSSGDLEDRPDLRDEVRRRVITGLAEEIRERGRDPVLADQETTPERRGRDIALASAVQDALVYCHYQRKRGRVIDYDLADTLQAYAPEGTDAVLCVDVLGIVPTTGREILKFTATAVGFLFNAQSHVSTNDAILKLMLVEVGTGEVLWFHTIQSEPDVRSDSRVRRFIDQACRFLLEPVE